MPTCRAGAAHQSTGITSARHNPEGGIMHGLMGSDGDIGVRVAKTFDRRHLNVIGRGRVKRHRAAEPNNCAGVGKESVGVRVTLDR